MDQSEQLHLITKWTNIMECNHLVRSWGAGKQWEALSQTHTKHISVAKEALDQAQGTAATTDYVQELPRRDQQVQMHKDLPNKEDTISMGPHLTPSAWLNSTIISLEVTWQAISLMDSMVR